MKRASRLVETPSFQPKILANQQSVMTVVMIVIVIIPIAVCTPAMAILIPPAVVMLPTPRASGGQFFAPVSSVGTVPAMMFRSFVQLMVGLDDAFLAIVIGTENRSASGKKNRAEGKGREKTLRRLGSGSWIDDHRFSKESEIGAGRDRQVNALQGS
jgi:predicted short-subunit dehydrogenase-like oxidoreductase (DUF2520 family)